MKQKKLSKDNKIYEMKFDLTCMLLIDFDNRKFHKIVSRNIGINSISSNIHISVFNFITGNLLW
jgi:hypothetical protein